MHTLLHTLMHTILHTLLHTHSRWVWPNGDCFEGVWHQSLKRPADQASAKMRWVGGDVYEGPWRYGHPFLGVVTWRARYVGDFKHGQEDGLGR